MNHRPVRAVLLAVVAAGVVAAQASSAEAQRQGGNTSDVVFVQTNETTGNNIVVYDRAANGQLTLAGTYATGGNGGIASPGTESDTLASQGSLVYVSPHRMLLAVNAGSDSVSAFSLDGNQLELEGVVPSGGQFPASIAVHKKLVYVLNSGGSGIVQGFEITNHGLEPLPGSTRDLGLANTDPPDFLTSPGQIGFSPDGRMLIVTTKASGSTIDVFRVKPNGRLSDAPVLNPSATPVPFAFTFTPNGRLVVGEAATSTVTTYDLKNNLTLVDPKSLSDNQMALCWIQRVGKFYYVSNTASNNLSGYRISADGQPSLVTPNGIVATTGAGPIDLTSPSGTSFLYAQIGSGTVEAYQVGSDGTLTLIEIEGGLPAGMEGIAST